jgi:hypothetical protein
MTRTTFGKNHGDYDGFSRHYADHTRRPVLITEDRIIEIITSIDVMNDGLAIQAKKVSININVLQEEIV